LGRTCVFVGAAAAAVPLGFESEGAAASRLIFANKSSTAFVAVGMIAQPLGGVE
jgi:hypothetical protein